LTQRLELWQDVNEVMNLEVEMRLLTATAALVLGTTIAYAAENPVAVLSDVSGKVLVNQGEGFVAAVGDIQLFAGDRVMVGDQSFAVVSYKDCAVSMDKPSMTTVSKEACEAAVISPVADIDPAPQGYAPLAGLPLAFLLPVGAVAIGGVLIATGVLGNDDSAS
jgi:hypothetical protein